MLKPVRYNFGQVLTHLSKTNAFYGRPSVVEKNVFFVDDTGFGSHGYWKLRHDSSGLTLIIPLGISLWVPLENAHLLNPEVDVPGTSSSLKYLQGVIPLKPQLSIPPRTRPIFLSAFVYLCSSCDSVFRQVWIFSSSLYERRYKQRWRPIQLNKNLRNRTNLNDPRLELWLRFCRFRTVVSVYNNKFSWLWLAKSQWIILQ